MKTNIQKNPEGQLSVDVFQGKDEIAVVAPVAGVKPEDVSITVTDNVLTIKGERSNGTTLNKEDCFIQECFWGMFSRSIVLPEDVDTTKVDAEFKNNILVIKIPRVERIKTRIVKIKKS